MRKKKELGLEEMTLRDFIAIFAMQSPIKAYQLPWTWDRLIAIALFAVPIWLVLHYGLMPVRNRK